MSGTWCHIRSFTFLCLGRGSMFRGSLPILHYECDSFEVWAGVDLQLTLVLCMWGYKLQKINSNEHYNNEIIFTIVCTTCDKLVIIYLVSILLSAILVSSILLSSVSHGSSFHCITIVVILFRWVKSCLTHCHMVLSWCLSQLFGTLFCLGEWSLDSYCHMILSWLLRSTKQSQTLWPTTHSTYTPTIQDIDNYVNTFTDTITQTIDEMVQSKTLKPNSVGLPQAIRDLIKEKRWQRRYWQQTTQHYKTNYNRLDRTIKQYTRRTRQNN